MTSGIVEILIEDTNIQALVGMDTRGQWKVYPMVCPDDPKVVGIPYVVVSEISLNPSLSKLCPSTTDQPRYNVDVYSLSFLETEVVQEACRVCLDSGQGWTTQLVTFNVIYMVDRSDLYLPAQGQAAGLFVKRGVYEAISKRTIT